MSTTTQPTAFDLALTRLSDAFIIASSETTDNVISGGLIMGTFKAIFIWFKFGLKLAAFIASIFIVITNLALRIKQVNDAASDSILENLSADKAIESHKSMSNLARDLYDITVD